MLGMSLAILGWIITFQFILSPCDAATDGTIRLVGASVDTYPREGRLEYYHGGWGTVCNDAFDINDGRVACRNLGLGFHGLLNDQVHQGQWSVGDTPPSTIILNSLGCTGAESKLSECTKLLNPTNCGHHEDIGIQCVADVDYLRCTESLCRDGTLNGIPYETTKLTCDGTHACDGATINGQNSASLTVTGTWYYSLQNAIINCSNNGGCTVKCEGPLSCRYAKIYAPNTAQITLICSTDHPNNNPCTGVQKLSYPSAYAGNIHNVDNDLYLSNYYNDMAQHNYHIVFGILAILLLVNVVLCIINVKSVLK
eukprot:UN00946